MLPAVTDLAKRHFVHGIMPEHYTAVGAALL
jgi:hemoglobin-like flavoprotein